MDDMYLINLVTYKKGIFKISFLIIFKAKILTAWLIAPAGVMGRVNRQEKNE